MTSYCSNCIHYKVCGNEGIDDSAMTFCADKIEQTDGDSISRNYTIQQIQKAKESNYNFNYNTLIDFIKVLPSAEKTAEWIVETDRDGTYGICSKCSMKQRAGRLAYCPSCGAKMKGK